jgi:hypothetical protein
MGLPNLAQRKAFKRFFNYELTAFFNPVIPELGFDVVKFDDFLKEHCGYDEEANGGTSMNDFILAKYGQGVLDFIGEIILL